MCVQRVLERLNAKSDLLKAALPRALRVDDLEEENARLKEALAQARSSPALEEEIRQLRERNEDLERTLQGEILVTFFRRPSCV